MTNEYTDATQGIEYIEIESQCPTGCAADTVIHIFFTGMYNPTSTKPVVNNFIAQTLDSSGVVIDSSDITDATGLDLIPNSFGSLDITSPALT